MGFQHLTPEQRQAMARKGGLKAQATGKAHRWTHETGKAAGRRGFAQWGRNAAARNAQREEGGDGERD